VLYSRQSIVRFAGSRCDAAAAVAVALAEPNAHPVRRLSRNRRIVRMRPAFLVVQTNEDRQLVQTECRHCRVEPCL
jgi:hypothetical protein